MPIKVLLFGQHGQSSHLSPLQDFKHSKTTLRHPHSHTHTHLHPSFHQVIFMGTTEPETREFIQVLLSCREKPFCITAVVLLKPFNQNQRASTYRGEDSHREEAMESPMVLVPAAAEARGTVGACLGQRLLQGLAAHGLSCSAAYPELVGNNYFCPKPTCGCLPACQGTGYGPQGLGLLAGRERSRAGVQRLSVAPSEKPATNTKSRQDKQIPLLRSCGAIHHCQRSPDGTSRHRNSEHRQPELSLYLKGILCRRHQ